MTNARRPTRKEMFWRLVTFLVTMVFGLWLGKNFSRFEEYLPLHQALRPQMSCVLEGYTGIRGVDSNCYVGGSR